jgi:hypothetical protein
MNAETLFETQTVVEIREVIHANPSSFPVLHTRTWICVTGFQQQYVVDGRMSTPSC